MKSGIIPRTVGLLLIMGGFSLWAYGFAYSSFWYANEAPSLLEPLRALLSESTGAAIIPGLVEESLGFTLALAGFTIRIWSS